MYIFIFRQLTSLYCNFSYGSKMALQNIFGTQKVGGAIFEINFPFLKVGVASLKPPIPCSAAPRSCVLSQRNNERHHNCEHDKIPVEIGQHLASTKSQSSILLHSIRSTNTHFYLSHCYSIAWDLSLIHI